MNASNHPATVDTQQAQSEDLKQTLAQHVAELDIAHQEIARLKLELEQTGRMKSQFLANMSHELRSPLNAIIGFSEILKDGLAGTITPQQSGFLTDICNSGKLLLSLINDIVDLSKIEAGKLELERAPSDLGSILQNCLSIVKEKAHKHRIQLQLEAEPVEHAMLDQRKTKQIVYNLLANAVKFTPDGGSVTLRAKPVARSRLQELELFGAPDKEGWTAERWLEISVADTGIGIRKDKVPLLFQAFVRVHDDLDKYEGAGLGLALVRELVELHAGALTVRSHFHEGSEFFVWLPLS
jgi:signal transduction histidine kinase